MYGSVNNFINITNIFQKFNVSITVLADYFLLYVERRVVKFCLLLFSVVCSVLFRMSVYYVRCYKVRGAFPHTVSIYTKVCALGNIDASSSKSRPHWGTRGPPEHAKPHHFWRSFAARQFGRITTFRSGDKSGPKCAYGNEAWLGGD